MAIAKEKQLVSLTGMKRELISIEEEVSSFMVNRYMRTAEILHDAKDQFSADDDEGGFIKWAMDGTEYTKQYVEQHLRVYNAFGEKSIFQDSKNPIPFNSLLELSKQNVPKKLISDTLRKYKNKNPTHRPTASEVKTLVREARPDTPTKVVIPERVFAERTEKSKEGKWMLKAKFLLNMDSFNNAETVRIVARHWKQKYHPDKENGHAGLFDQIVKAEKQLLAERGES